MMLLVLAGFQNPSAQDSLAQQTIAHLARVGYSIAQEQWIVTDSGGSAVILTLRPALAHLTALMVGAIQVEPAFALGTRVAISQDPSTIAPTVSLTTTQAIAMVGKLSLALINFCVHQIRIIHSTTCSIAGWMTRSKMGG
jgi:hypothetical protein